MVREDEPQWLPEDQDAALVWASEQRLRFSCGHFMWESEDPDFDPLDRFVVDHMTCKWCQPTEAYARQLVEGSGSLDGVRIGWFPKEEHGV